MRISIKKPILIFLFSACFFHFVYAQDTGSLEDITTKKNYTLILTKKSNAKKHQIKTGDRLIIQKENAEEIEGVVSDIRQHTIHFKKGSVMLSEVYSIQKKPTLKRQIIGGVIAGVASLFILTGTLVGGMLEDGGTGSLVIGGGLAAASLPLLINKTFSKKRWDFKIE